MIMRVTVLLLVYNAQEKAISKKSSNSDYFMLKTKELANRQMVIHNAMQLKTR